MHLRIIPFLLVAAWTGLLGAADAVPSEKKTNEVAAPIFIDRNLEKAVRRQVFEKRDNDKPITEADVFNIAVLQGAGLEITNLAGLEKCVSLAELDLPRNRIADLTPLKNLKRLQSLTLSDNRISDLSPLVELTALQYLDLSRNQVKALQPLAGLTNLASLYLGGNQVSDLAPVANLNRLSSLYLEGNRLENMTAVSGLKNLSILSLSTNSVSELTPLRGLNNLSMLFLERNKIKDLAPLAEMARADKEQRFAPFWKIYLKGNPLAGAAKKQIQTIEETGGQVVK